MLESPIDEPLALTPVQVREHGYNDPETDATLDQLASGFYLCWHLAQHSHAQ